MEYKAKGVSYRSVGLPDYNPTAHERHGGWQLSAIALKLILGYPNCGPSNVVVKYSTEVERLFKGYQGGEGGIVEKIHHSAINNFNGGIIDSTLWKPNPLGATRIHGTVLEAKRIHGNLVNSDSPHPPPPPPAHLSEPSPFTWFFLHGNVFAKSDLCGS